MKKINFVKTSIFDQKKTAKRAPKIAALTTIISFSIILMLQIQQWKRLQRITQEKEFNAKKMAQFDTVLAQKRTLKSEQELLEKKINKLSGIQNNTPLPFTLFTEIEKALGATGTLESLTTEQKKIDMIINCQTIKKATKFMQTINSLPSIAFLDLVAIYPQGQRFLCTITGKRT